MGPFDAAIVLAAGGGSRMGGPKALLRWGSSTWAAAHAERLAGWCDRVVVVVGAEGDAVAASLPAGALVVWNRAWATSHPADSARLGALALGERVTRVVVTPVDVVPAEPAWLAALAAAAAPAVVVTPSGARGHPVLLGPRELGRLRVAGVAGGLRSLLEEAAAVAVDDERAAADADDPAAWAALRGER